MTGAGFGGCAIAIVEHDGVESFVKTVSSAYENIIGYAPDMYICENGHGAMEVI